LKGPASFEPAGSGEPGGVTNSELDSTLITFRSGSLEISSRYAKQTLDFRYQRNIGLIASESSADEVLSIQQVSIQIYLQLCFSASVADPKNLGPTFFPPA
jgi:hypothetical protein